MEVGETMIEALGREMMEEGNIEIGEGPRLFGIYFNRKVSDRDHVALFLVERFSQSIAPQPNAEIVAHGFFDRDSLPADTAPGTRARIAEVLDRTRPAELW